MSYWMNTVKIWNLMRTRNSILFKNEIEILIFFLIVFQIYSNKALDSINSVQKSLLTQKIKNSLFVQQKFSLAFVSVRFVSIWFDLFRFGTH